MDGDTAGGEGGRGIARPEGLQGLQGADQIDRPDLQRYFVIEEQFRLEAVRLDHCLHRLGERLSEGLDALGRDGAPGGGPVAPELFEQGAAPA